MRETGILLHPTSLPGPGPAGTLGAEAFAFVDALAEAGVRVWQVLPTGPAGIGGSPYMSPSAFAGNIALIEPRWLVEHGLLEENELAPAGSPTSAIDVRASDVAARWCLELAADRFAAGSGDPALAAEFASFCERADAWLPAWIEFATIDTLFAGAPWPEWPAPLRDRDRGAIDAVLERHEATARRERFAQFVFDRQWSALREHARHRGVSLFGDVPIFVSHHSADVWGLRALFDLDERGWPRHVAGVPPDYFSETGQRWGNPLYVWEHSARTGHAWWIARFARAFELCDRVRVDHFRGFEAYWEIPALDPTAIGGHWVAGPGRSLFDAVFAALGRQDVIAEDLGVITPGVEALRDGLGLPGMKILHFAFGSGDDNVHLPHHHGTRSVAYTGTHDNDTTIGWWDGAEEHVRDHVRRYLGIDGLDIAWQLIEAALRSPADLAVLPMQDVLELGTEARMNTPGTSDGNWGWRMLPGAFDEHRIHRLRELIASSDRR